MKKLPLVFFVIFILGFGACDNESKTTPPPKEYTVEVVGGSGSGVYTEGETATIVSTASFFLWWQVDGKNEKLSTEETYSFQVSEDIKIISVGKERNLGFAIAEAPVATFFLNRIYDFTFIAGLPTGTAFISKDAPDDTEVGALFLSDNMWWQTSGFTLIAPGGVSQYTRKDRTLPIYCFYLWRDLDGTAKATCSYPVDPGNSTLQRDLANGYSILFP